MEGREGLIKKRRFCFILLPAYLSVFLLKIPHTDALLSLLSPQPHVSVQVRLIACMCHFKHAQGITSIV